MGYYQHNSNSSEWIYPAVNLLAIPLPAKVPLVADSYPGTRGDGAAGLEVWRSTYAAHGDATYGNVLMLDGHMERVHKPPTGEKHKNSEVPTSFEYTFRPSL